MKVNKVLIVTADYPPPMGGIQVFTYELEQELKRSGHIVEVLNFDGRNTSTYKQFRLRDLFYTKATRIGSFPLRKILNPLDVLDISGGYRDFVYKNMIYRVSQEAIKAFKPDLVHIMKNDLYSAVFEIEVPYIVSCHSSNVDIYDAPHVHYSLQHAAKIHCVSEFTKKLVVEVAPSVDKNIEVIYNFIDLVKYKNIFPAKENRILTVSRMSKIKNVATLIKAYALLPLELQKKYEYLIIGGGEELESLKKLSKDLGILNLQFTGEVSDEVSKIDVISRSKVFLSCPTPINGEVETFGIAFIEAQALGVPVICSTIGGIPEAVGQGGLYVSNELDPQEIAQTLERLLVDEALYASLQAEVSARIGQFDKKIWFGKMLALYREAAHA